MYRIINNRGTGKTSSLLLLAKETGAIFVCANPNIARQRAERYGLEGITFISYSDFLGSKPVGTRDAYVIDEVEGLLKHIHYNVIGYTLSVGERS